MLSIFPTKTNNKYDDVELVDSVAKMMDTAAASSAIAPSEPKKLPAIPENEHSKKLFQCCRTGDLEGVLAIIEELRLLEMAVAEAEDNVIGEQRIGQQQNQQQQEQQVVGAPVQQQLVPMDVVLNMPDSIESMSTCLHIAAESGYDGIVYFLLQAGADPTRVDIRSRPPYFLAKTKDTRDAFRRARATAGTTIPCYLFLINLRVFILTRCVYKGCVLVSGSI
jgi:hypothetical protein